MIIGVLGGNGKMGHAFAEFFRKNGETVLIADRGTTLSNREVAKKADVVLVAVPIDLSERIILDIAPLVRKNALFLDVTSIKEKPVTAMLKSHASVIGMHPMCNETTFGPGQILIYCPARLGKWMPWFKQTFEKKGGFKLVKFTPQHHDELMSFAQALIHGTGFALGKTLAQLKPHRDEVVGLSGAASRILLKIVARHFAQDASLYGNIQIQNPRNIAVLKALENSVHELRTVVEKRDLKGFMNYFNEGKNYFGNFGDLALEETDGMIQRMMEVSLPKITDTPPKNGIGCLGPELTFSSLAADQWRAKNSTANEKKAKDRPLVYFRTIPEVVQAVAQGKIQAGVVPIENRLHGTVRETMDALFKENVTIVDEFKCPIHQTFATLANVPFKSITGVMSHPQALHQCSEYLKKNCPNAKWITADSTAAAFDYVRKYRTPKIAVIGPLPAAKAYGFKIVAESVENDSSNETRFVVITKNSPRNPLLKTVKNAKKATKTSIVFYFSENKPGSLFRVFEIFAELGINLSRIESRPAPKKVGEYLLYLDFDENGHSPRGKQALTRVKKEVSGIKVLGVY
ncbi:MAG: prephenate dehydratase [Candidatus Gracilibacteria bacterium]